MVISSRLFKEFSSDMYCWCVLSSFALIFYILSYECRISVIFFHMVDYFDLFILVYYVEFLVACGEIVRVPKIYDFRGSLWLSLLAGF